MKLVRMWDRFWFKPQQTLTIGVVRALAGFVLLCYCILMAGHVGEWFTDDGLVSLSVGQAFTGPGHFSFLFMFPGRAAAYTVFGALMLSSITMMLGYYSRASCICAFLCLLSLDQRNLVILNSGDTMLKLLTFYLCLAPTEASFSLDAIRRRKSGVEHPSPVSGFLNDLKYGGPSGPSATPWALRLIQVQISLVYCSTLLCKLPGVTWRNGTALYLVDHLSEMARFPMPSVVNYPLLLNLATWFALLAEFSMAVLVWFGATRLFALLLGLMLHLGIEYSMNVPLFSTTMAVSYLAFLDLQYLWDRFQLTPGGQRLAVRLARWRGDRRSAPGSNGRRRPADAPTRDRTPAGRGH